MAKGLQNLDYRQQQQHQQRGAPVLMESPRFSSTSASSGACRRDSVGCASLISGGGLASSWQGRDSIFYVQNNDNIGLSRSSVLANLMSITGSRSGIEIVSGPSNLAQQINSRNFGL